MDAEEAEAVALFDEVEVVVWEVMEARVSSSQARE